MDGASGKRRKHLQGSLAEQHQHHAGHQPEEDRRKQKASAQLSVTERLLMGRISEHELGEKGIQLSPEQLELYRRIKQGY